MLALSILARVLMWMACLPLLQPTGLCICKGGGYTRAQPHQQADPDHTTSADCSCRGCRIGRDHTPPARAPARDDDSHIPGCPASPGVDRYKWADPTPSLHSPLPPVALVTVLPDLSAAKPIKFAACAVTWPSDPPLYLSHCTLVI